MQEFVRELNRGGRYCALYCSLESAKLIPEPERGIPAVLGNIASAIKWSPVKGLPGFGADTGPSDFSRVVREALRDFCARLDRPLVIVFDEADALADGTLIALLSQLRDGYVNRADIPFVHSIALVGMRNIRDYKARIRPESDTLGSYSPFNIFAKALTLRNFTLEDVGRLYQQHTEETGQAFSDDVIERVFHYTQGQPWLVNAIAREIVEELLGRDVSLRIEVSHVDQAVQNIIVRRGTHIDSLLARLTEERVRRVIEPVITGKKGAIHRGQSDYEFVRDLGLVRDDRGVVEPANPIYGEVIVRWLNYDAQEDLRAEGYPYALPRYVGEDGQLDVNSLLREFQQFWRENSEVWEERFEHKEAAPHLILMAFLQRVLNAGGYIRREFAAGRGRMDLCVEFQDQRYPIEIKIRYGDKTVEEGQSQLLQYMDRLGCDEGWLVVFDRRPDVPWDEKTRWETPDADGKVIHVVGG